MMLSDSAKTFAELSEMEVLILVLLDDALRRYAIAPTRNGTGS